MKIHLLIILCFVTNLLFAQQQGERPKIGLALSGGGAKGLAHIGVLKAIDSAGIKVDYVAGTSMGAIVGSLYAVGYSGNEIEAIAHKLDWNKILSNKSSYDMLILPQKRNSGKYLEIPLIEGKFSFRKGIIESNELWLTFNELLFPYLATKDFSDFKRAFRCMAADIETGDLVILKSGNIAQAIRASMAIPAAFTPVTIDGRTLVDGGIARNFPVSEAKEMGAGVVIGSSVASPLLKSNEIDNPFQMVSQLAFYQENKDFQEQVKLAGILVNHPIEAYSASSFSSSDDIIKIGIEQGKALYPRLIKLKDSLDAIYGKEPLQPHPDTGFKKKNEVFVSKFTTTGLSEKEKGFYLNVLGFSDHKMYSASFLSDRIRKVFGAGIFRKINYELIPDVNSDSYTINLLFEKDPQHVLKTGLHYNTETGIALKLAFSMFGVSNPFTETSIETSIGEAPRIRIGNIYFFNHRRSWYLESSASGAFTDMSAYNEKMDKVGLYNQRHLKVEASINNLVTNNFLIGAGTRYEYLKYKPKIKTVLEAEGELGFVTSFANLRFDNRENNSYPNSGNKIDVEVGFNYAQHADFTYDDGTTSGTQHQDSFGKKPYFSLRYYSSHHLPVGKHSFFLKLNSGIHFGNKQPVLNDFIIGGNNAVIRNQILFAGFRANAVSSSSVISPQLGFQYNFGANLVANAIVNYLKYDFVKTNYIIDANRKNAVLGAGLAIGYKSFIGPLEAVFMYNNISDKIVPSFNIGYALDF
ncbi:patatin-like phospholipase family protein [Sphingobacterium siyangense]|uniref:NTE family protein n=1 Tax=Sphingobacterium siyangense TaxID=459529 RepID=A0A562MG61_9SPHI|nr:patatin-like phospholipase family protein [Sphingobacterium siyangense]TWI18808.1 NTE family protein [Sphingobacterium siyangense]